MSVNTCAGASSVCPAALCGCYCVWYVTSGVPASTACTKAKRAKRGVSRSGGPCGRRAPSWPHRGARRGKEIVAESVEVGTHVRLHVPRAHKRHHGSLGASAHAARGMQRCAGAAARRQYEGAQRRQRRVQSVNGGLEARHGGGAEPRAFQLRGAGAAGRRRHRTAHVQQPRLHLRELRARRGGASAVPGRRRLRGCAARRLATHRERHCSGAFALLLAKLSRQPYLRRARRSGQAATQQALIRRAVHVGAAARRRAAGCVPCCSARPRHPAPQTRRRLCRAARPCRGRTCPRHLCACTTRTCEPHAVRGARRCAAQPAGRTWAARQ